MGFLLMFDQICADKERTRVKKGIKKSDPPDFLRTLPAKDGLISP